jgi:hypothetical protein
LRRQNFSLADLDWHPELADPDPYLFQPNVKLNNRYVFPENFKKFKIMTPLALMRKMKQCQRVNVHYCKKVKKKL